MSAPQETNSMDDLDFSVGIDPTVMKIINPSFSARIVRRIRGFINHWLYKSGFKKY